MATFWPAWRRSACATQADYEKEIEQLRRKAPIPSLWLFGKTDSGKSSTIRYLTGAESATIGEGYRPETKTSRRFDFPDSVEPLLSFIDTRGLGEAAYARILNHHLSSSFSRTSICCVQCANGPRRTTGEIRSLRKNNRLPTPWLIRKSSLAKLWLGTRVFTPARLIRRIQVSWTRSVLSWSNT